MAKSPTIRAAVTLISAAALILAPTTVASAHPEADDGAIAVDDGARDVHQHGGDEGHLPATQSNVELVSKLKLKNVVPEKIADVGVFNGYAYLAAWGSVECKYNGVHVVDIQDPANTKEVAFIQAKEGSYPGEGIQTVHIDTPAFTGDVLVSNNEKCKDKAGFGGMNLYDVTNPEHPTPLAEGVGDSVASGQGKKDANEIHSVFAWDAGDKAYAVIVDNEEGTDVDIMDITNPKKPFLTAEYDLDETFPQILQNGPANLTEIFLHDIIVKEIGGKQVMLLSYWDAGYVTVDMSDVHNPAYIGDTDFANPDPELLESAGLAEKPEGNGHQGEFTLDNNFMIAADEDFSPHGSEGTTDDSAAAFQVSQGDSTPNLHGGESLSGDAVYVGQACPGDPAVPAAGTTASGQQIAVVSRGVCTFTEKVASIEAAGGYEGIVIVNREGFDGCGQIGISVEGSTPTFSVDRQTGLGFFDKEAGFDNAACLAGTATLLPGVSLGEVGDLINLRAFFDGWGYVHLFDNSAGKMTELDTYAIPEAHDPAYAEGFGDLSVHEVATSHQRNDLAYFSYYSGGFRVTKIVDNKLVETGSFIDEGGSNFWGVEVFESNGVEYVAASDRDSGLYIFRYTGE
ncbi:PA domain-containing protein [Arthrobacter rhizosphaerae]|uniref:PA domain-containing protein n=1 Tax=Arthrobacter rhizosphaerae TaxID=2855490 RepID=UPI001FF32934|nr:PA domain-containing protein [Arthrobacter rhizosphaerae]